MNSSMSVPGLKTTVRCRVAACATLRASAEAIGQARKQPVTVGAAKMPISFLKHSDDQTVLALMSVLQALEQSGLRERSFTDWGVVAASNLFGRIGVAQTIQRFQQEGAYGVSPHLIPHQSPHAVSGTISQALKVYGPNFGIGGGPNSAPDAFLIAAAMMIDRRLPGLWVILTGYESEWIPAADGQNGTPPMCQAVALALTAADSNRAGMFLSVGHVCPSAKRDFSLTLLPDFQLSLLADELTVREGVPAGKWRLADSHWLEVESNLGEREDEP